MQANRISRVLSFLLALAIGLCTAVPLAAGQGDTARARSQDHFARALQHLQAQHYREAIEELEAARSLYPTASIHFNLGLAYREVQRVSDAIAAFERFLEASGPGIDPARRDEVDRYLRSLRASLARLHVQASPASARIALDGEPVGRGQADLAVEPGPHQVTVSAPGHVDVDREIDIAPGTDETLHIQLEERRTAGTLALEVTPDLTTVSVDGRLRGVGDMELELASGPHHLLMEAAGARREHDFQIVPGERLTLAFTMLQGDDLTWLWVTLGVVVAAGAAVAIAAVALNPSDQPPLMPNLGLVHTALEGP